MKEYWSVQSYMDHSRARGLGAVVGGEYSPFTDRQCIEIRGGLLF